MTDTENVVVAWWRMAARRCKVGTAKSGVPMKMMRKVGLLILFAFDALDGSA